MRRYLWIVLSCAMLLLFLYVMTVRPPRSPGYKGHEAVPPPGTAREGDHAASSAEGGVPERP